MGKQRRQRNKLHTSPKKDKTETVSTPLKMDTAPPLSLPTTNPFSNININFSSLKKSLNDDNRSVKSFKSSKGSDKVASKKDKLRLRREYLLGRIDTIKQLQKDAKVRSKRKKTAIIGDTNALHDALPTLESLIKSRPAKPRQVQKSSKPRGIPKELKRRKAALDGMKMYKSILTNKTFKANPLNSITEHVRAVVEQEKMKKS